MYRGPRCLKCQKAYESKRNKQRAAGTFVRKNKIYANDAERRAGKLETQKAYRERRRENPDTYAAWRPISFEALHLHKKMRYSVKPCLKHGAPPIWGHCSFCVKAVGLRIEDLV